ncbi:MAG: hypothetical protein DRO46_01350 [Candidatus Hecatellales archaeon]|nr:MAG: hypothetical protein DRO46_01350 [Candidatus Hecatellales archaeon]
MKGERWMAVSGVEVKAGSLVRVVGKEGPILRVEPLKEEKGG